MQNSINQNEAKTSQKLIPWQRKKYDSFEKIMKNQDFLVFDSKISQSKVL